MAQSPKGAGNPLLPIAIIAVTVVAILAAVFTMTGTEPPGEATIVPEEVNAEADGGSETPEAESASTSEGAASGSDASTEPEDSDSVPEEATPADDTNGMDDQGGSGNDGGSGQSSGDGSAGTGATGDTSAQGTGGADGEQGDDAGTSDQEDTSNEDAGSDFLLDENSDNPEAGTPETTQPSGGGEQDPEGRDAETQLDPEQDQDVVRDTDQGGAAFVPTPSGPEGRDDSAATPE
jgi:hypothetical protein